ncbi:MAG: SRPBCC domain-containing protein [Terracidiphilus sp.]
MRVYLLDEKNRQGWAVQTLFGPARLLAEACHERNHDLHGAPEPPLDASPERVFDAWFCAEGRWFFGTQSGDSISLDRNGSSTDSCWIVWLRQTPGRRGTLTTMPRGLAEHIVIDRPHRVIIDIPERTDSRLRTRMAVEILSAADGCELTLTLEGILKANRSITEGNWSRILDRLAKDLGGS